MTEFIERVIAYTDEITYFGENSAAHAIAKAASGQAADAYTLSRALLRRHTLLGSKDDDLTIVAQEWGARRQGPQRSRVLVVLRPWTSKITSITSNSII